MYCFLLPNAPIGQSKSDSPQWTDLDVPFFGYILLAAVRWMRWTYQILLLLRLYWLHCTSSSSMQWLWVQLCCKDIARKEKERKEKIFLVTKKWFSCWVPFHIFSCDFFLFSYRTFFFLRRELFPVPRFRNLNPHMKKNCEPSLEFDLFVRIVFGA